MSNKSSKRFAISICVKTIEKASDYSKSTNLKCKITVQTTESQWTFSRSMKELEVFHANLQMTETLRGINLPKLPIWKRSPWIDEYITQKRNESSQYLSEICHRSILLGTKNILDFIAAPETVRRTAKKVMESECIPFKSGQMKKEGEKWKGYRSRYFVLLPNYLLQYYETADAFQIGIGPKGCIDLTLATKILVYDITSCPYSMGIKTPSRIWKLQCDTESARDEWVNALRTLLQNPMHSGYIEDYNDYIRVRIKNGYKENQEDIKEEKSAQTDNNNNNNKEINEYKQQLDVQKETMLKWKQKLHELKQEMVKYKDEIDELSMNFNELKHINIEQRKDINIKDECILQTRNELKLRNIACDELEKDAMDAKSKEWAINDVLCKVQGDSISKLKCNKQSNKLVTFINGINHLFYYNYQDSKAPDTKHIVVKAITLNDQTIQKSIHKPWFLIIGHKRSALFVTETKAIRDKWVQFISKSLENDDALCDDEKKKDE